MADCNDCGQSLALTHDCVANLKRERDEARGECERLNRQINNEVATAMGIIEKNKELEAACAAMREALELIYKTATSQPSWASVVADTARNALNHE